MATEMISIYESIAPPNSDVCVLELELFPPTYPENLHGSPGCQGKRTRRADSCPLFLFEQAPVI